MAEMVVTDRSGKEHRVTGRVGTSLMENLRDADLDASSVTLSLTSADRIKFLC